MQECNVYLHMMHARSVCCHKPRKKFKASGIYGGIRTFSHVQQLVDLQRCIVSVPAGDFILAQQYLK
jgi:hypothetical protein